MENKEITKIPCCPELLKDDNCDVLFFTRTLDYLFFFQKEMRISAQLILGFKLSRCTLGLVLGDPAYTTTLLPGEKVRLSTTDRRSKFTYDTSSQLSYRSEQMSEEQYFMLATQSYLSNIENQQSGTATTTEKGRWDFKGEADAGLESLTGIGVNASANGSYNNTSTLEYLNNQSSNMRAAATQAVNATHMAHSVSVGEVSSRTHAEGQSEDHFESSSREFHNDNNCHALTFVFYRLNKKQKIKFELVSLQETISLPENRLNKTEIYHDILKALRNELISVGIIDKNGEILKEYKAKFDFEMETTLPTAGIQVKGCLDECNTCEPERARFHKLQNDLLEKQVDLLEKAQEYRCCPLPPTDTDK